MSVGLKPLGLNVGHIPREKKKKKECRVKEQFQILVNLLT